MRPTVGPRAIREQWVAVDARGRTDRENTRVGTSAVIRELAPPEVRGRIAGLADVLIDCVEGGSSVGFMLPLARKRAEAFWTHVADSAEAGERIVLIAEQPAPDGSREVLGTVQVIFASYDNQPHRADIAKMLVRRSARRQGLGERLLRAAEAAALRARRTLLVLDTVPGTPAERLYLRCGWTPVGIVPGFALMPDGRECDTRFFYKRLEAVA